jgi:hypothetical protein
MFDPYLPADERVVVGGAARSAASLDRAASWAARIVAMFLSVFLPTATATFAIVLGDFGTLSGCCVCAYGSRLGID